MSPAVLSHRHVTQGGLRENRPASVVRGNSEIPVFMSLVSQFSFLVLASPIAFSP